ncbi:MAG: TRAP transporter TatT component family protein [Treponema sp.]|jgi:predicted anti-sigma-YlaC factor YlaD|nr:TRAP transporter TatT component family protein [Treponema sp.]
MKQIRRSLPALLAAPILLASCSINKMAINAVSNALSGAGTNEVFSGDRDPQLVGDALPFAIKMYEALLKQNPNHSGLQLTTGSLFIMYANAFVQGPADMLPAVKYEEREAARLRAKNFYLRGAEIINKALDKKYPGLSTATVADGSMAPLLAKCKKEDVPFLYWSVAGGLSAYSIDVFDFERGARLPEFGEMIARAYELDPDFNNGALDEFYILYYASLPEMMGGDKEKAKIHFERALEKTGGNSAGAYVSYAQTVCVPARDYESFKANLEKALAVDVDADEGTRLVNIINQKKAQFLLDNAYIYFSFLPPPDEYDSEYYDYEEEF